MISVSCRIRIASAQQQQKRKHNNTDILNWNADEFVIESVVSFLIDPKPLPIHFFFEFYELRNIKVH